MFRHSVYAVWKGMRQCCKYSLEKDFNRYIDGGFATINFFLYFNSFVHSFADNILSRLFPCVQGPCVEENSMGMYHSVDVINFINLLLHIS